MMTAYIDESGHEGKGWMFLAGYLGNEDQWSRFVNEWKSGLGPQRKLLHMKDLRWNQDRTKHLLAKLGPIPEACGLTPILGGARFGDYEDLVSGTPVAKMLKAWIACLFSVVLDTLRVIPDHERLEFVFEEQREYERYAHMVLSHVVADDPWKQAHDGKPKIAKWSFVPKGSTILTDPADYLAFALRELWTDKKSKKTDWCMPILKSGHGIGKILRREQIREIVHSAMVMSMFEHMDNEMLRLYRMTKGMPGL